MPSLQQFSGYPGASLGIGEGVVVILHIETACGGNGLELMVFQVGLQAAGCCKGVEELILGIIHLIGAEDCTKATLIKWSVMGNQGQSLNQGFYPCPHVWENGSLLGILTAKAVNLGTPIVIVVRLWMNERVELIHNLSVPNDDHTNRTYRRTIIVGRFKIYSCKISHGLIFLISVTHTLEFRRYFFTKPLRLEHFNILTLPEQFLNKVKSGTNE